MSAFVSSSDLTFADQSDVCNASFQKTMEFGSFAHRAEYLDCEKFANSIRAVGRSLKDLIHETLLSTRSMGNSWFPFLHFDGTIQRELPKGFMPTDMC